MLAEKFFECIARDASVSVPQVRKVVDLLEGDATIPFIARYRKDATGNLDEVKLEAIFERYKYFSVLGQRRKAILESVEKQGKLSDDLRQAIEACTDKLALEDIYLPYKKQRRTKASVARERGLEALADFIWNQEPGAKSIEETAQEFVSEEKGVATADEALQGAKHLLADKVATQPDVRSFVRDQMTRSGKVASHATKNCDGKKTKFESYYDFRENVRSIPSHRMLAIGRGAKEGFLRVELALDDEPVLAELESRIVKDKDSAFAQPLKDSISDGYHRLMRPAIENEVMGDARRRAEQQAIDVFRANTASLFLAAPAGPMAVLGLDPGFRSGCKLAVVDQSGALIEHATIFPHEKAEKGEEAQRVLGELITKHTIGAIAVGNGTGSREACAFVKRVCSSLEGCDAFPAIVNEAGASIYSTSKVAREEFPDLDATIRGAISIARRLQDPLAELVKIEPRHVGVGQYQHDVNQKRLREGLHRSVVSCVNRVGVSLNTASVALLRYVSGIQYGTAQNIVNYRSKHGPFRDLAQLNEVEGIGPKVFEQSAGFLRIRDGENPLDATAIHPEAYSIVLKIAQDAGLELKDIIGNGDALKDIETEALVSEELGEHTLKDIQSELLKPGLDPRRKFKAPTYLEGVTKVNDLEAGMDIEGMVTNVTDFGAFVDIGVHQDGLVHLSELANHFVRDPREMVHVGQIVKVRVITVDKETPRVSLSLKALHPAKPKSPRKKVRKPQAEQGERARETSTPAEARKKDNDGHAPTSERPRRPRPRRDTRSKQENGKPARRHDKGRGPKTHSSGDQGSINTLLADQLAALKEKLGS